MHFFFQAVTNEDVTQEELGGAKTHTSLSGKLLVQAIFVKFKFDVLLIWYLKSI